MSPIGFRRGFAFMFTFLLSLICFAGTTPAQEIVTTPTGSKVVIDVRPASPRNHVGEPIEVVVEYRFPKPERWPSDKPWKQDVFPVIPGNVILSVFGPTTDPLPQREDLSPSTAGPLLQREDLSPSDGFCRSGPDTFTRTFILPEWVKLSEPGAYRIRIETEFTTDGTKEKRYYVGSGEKRNNSDLPKSSIFSVTGQGNLDLFPPDSARLGELINEIGPLALKTDSNREWERLLLVEDPRVVPFLAQWLEKMADIPDSYQPTFNEEDYPTANRPPGHIREVEIIHLMFRPGELEDQVIPKEIRFHPLELLMEKFIERLSRFDDDQTIRVLVKASKSRYYDVRLGIVRGLHNFKTSRGFGILAAMRKDQDSFIRQLVAEGLRADSTPETERALRELLRDRDSLVRDAAQQSLATRKATRPE